MSRLTGWHATWLEAVLSLPLLLPPPRLMHGNHCLWHRHASPPAVTAASGTCCRLLLAMLGLLRPLPALSHTS